MSCVTVDYRIIGGHVREFRLKQKLTQDQLAERAGISPKFLGNIERGNAIPSVNTLLSLCDALELTPNDLLRCSSAHDPNAPCTLRDDHSVFTDTLDSRFCAQEHTEMYISLYDLPAFDIDLPDTAFTRKSHSVQDPDL